MRNLLNLYGGKISYFNVLRSPPDDNNVGGNDSGNNAGGDQNQNNGGGNDGQNQQQQKTKDDDDLGIEDVFGAGDDDGTITLQDDDDSGNDEPSAQQQAAGAALGTRLKNDISGFKVTPEDLKDVDFSDPASVATAMTNMHQKAIQQSVSMVPHILNHALGIVVGKMEQKINKAVGQTSKQTDAQKSFDALGITDKADRAFAKTIFQRALQNKMTPEQAAKATRNSLTSLGKPPKGNSGNGKSQGGRSGNAPAIQTGADALAGLFDD